MNKTHLPVLVATALLLSGIATARADAVTDWNAIMLQTTAGQNPFAQARIAAIAHLAVFEAVNAITADYEPYLGTVSAPAGASAEAAAIAAAHRALRHYLPASAATLDAARAASLAALPAGTATDAGVAAGEAAAAAMIALRENDGSAPPAFHVPESTDPGAWQTTPACPPAGGVLRHWGEVATFGVESGARFRAEPPPPLVSGRYAKDYAEVLEVGSVASTKRTEDRAGVARFYNAVLAVSTWNAAANQIARARGDSLAQNARTFALLNVAISDGLVTVMESKYHYAFWRPETAIHAGEADGNGHTDAGPDYAPYIVTPCFPSYPSAHATASYAARAVAERIFGEDGHSITLSTPAVAGVVLDYDSFEQITRDIDDARIFGGIHFRFDQEAGARQGRRIGAWLHAHLLEPARNSRANERCVDQRRIR